MSESLAYFDHGLRPPPQLYHKFNLQRKSVSDYSGHYLSYFTDSVTMRRGDVATEPRQ